MVPYFSLILPCYNVGAYVERCVRSILSQSFGNYEIILMDDGSKDSTPEICDRMAAENTCIRVIHKQNGGLSSARNAGLEIARGQYVWFIDSDDWIEPDALDALHAACAEGTPDIVKFDYYRVAEGKQRVIGLIPAGQYEGELLADIRRSAFCTAGRYTLSAWSHVYRRNFLLENSLAFVSERIVCSEDYLFNLQALMHVCCMHVIAQPLYNYELRPGSLTQTYKPDLAERYAELHRRLKACCDEYGQLADRFYVWHLAAGTCIPHMYRHGARRNVRALFGAKALKQAIINSDKAGLAWQKHIQLCAMYLGLEPLFYYLHVVKPGRQRNTQGKGMML